MATLTTVFSNCSAAVTSNLSVSAAAQRGRAPRAYTSRHVQGSVPPAALQYAETRAAGELGQRGYTLTAPAPGYNVTMLQCYNVTMHRRGHVLCYVCLTLHPASRLGTCRHLGPGLRNLSSRATCHVRLSRQRGEQCLDCCYVIVPTHRQARGHVWCGRR